MAHINVNFDEVPDRWENLEPGVYTMIVEEASVEPTAKGDGEKVVVKLRVNDEDSPQNNRGIQAHIGLKNPITLKQLIRSCGLELTDAFDTDYLVGCNCACRVKARTYTDKETGETKETTSVDEFLWED